MTSRCDRPASRWYRLLLGAITLTAIVCGTFRNPLLGRQPSPRLVVDVANELVGMPRRVRVVANEVFVLSGEEAIVVFDRDFNRKRRIGRIGRGPDDLWFPVDFDVCASGDVVVADLNNSVIRRFAPTGELQSSFASQQPQFIDCLSNGNVAVGERSASVYIRVYTADGKVVEELGEPDPYPGATPRQSLAFQEGPFRELSNGDFIVAQRLSLPPTALILGQDGAPRARFALPGPELEELLGEARERRKEILAEGRIGGRGTVNYATVHPVSGQVWVAPGAEGIYRFAPSGTLIDRLEVTDAKGQRYGFQDFDFLSPTEIVGRAGPLLVRAKLVGGN